MEEKMRFQAKGTGGKLWAFSAIALLLGVLVILLAGLKITDFSLGIFIGAEVILGSIMLFVKARRRAMTALKLFQSHVEGTGLRRNIKTGKSTLVRFSFSYSRGFNAYIEADVLIVEDLDNKYIIALKKEDMEKALKVFFPWEQK